MDNNQKFQALYAAGIKAYPEISKKKIQSNITNLWNEIKAGNKIYEDELKRLQEKITEKKSQGLNYWVSFSKREVTHNKSKDNECQVVTTPPLSSTSGAPTREYVHNPEPSTSGSNRMPAQEKLKKEKAEIESKISDLNIFERTLGSTSESERKMKVLMKEKEALVAKMKRAKQNQASQQRQRDIKRNAIAQLEKDNPEAYKRLKVGKTPGRPALESYPDMAGLHQAILDIVIPQSSADERRRSEVYKSCQNLNSLKEKLSQHGFNLSRTALYYR